MNQKKNVTRWIFTLLLLPVVAINVWCAVLIHHFSRQRAVIKFEYSNVNAIRYGLFSVSAWRNNIRDIVSDRIADFTLTQDQEEVLRTEINDVLNALVDQADSTINHPKSLNGKIKKAAINVFVDWAEVRKKIPTFTQTILDEINKPENREKVKVLAEEKVNEFAVNTYDPGLDTLRIQKLLSKYHAAGIEDFNLKTAALIDSLQIKTYRLTFIMLGSMLLFLLMWLFVWKRPLLHRPLFVLSVLLSLIVLLVALTSPMIEIDARIKKIDFVLLGTHLQFHDQVFFYQSKSILQVVHILFKTKKPDSEFVALLILAFSILFPIAKLISTEVYLLGNEKTKKNKIINFFAFKSGKWSMADVTVVAIFMAYVGFNGILTNQLKFLNIRTETLNSITTNLTSLQPGFILFVAFVIFGLVISEILKRLRRISSPLSNG